MMTKTSYITRNRVDWIDAVKGVGIMLVVIGHIYPEGLQRLWFLTYGFMPLFFVMSGLTNKPLIGYASPIKKKMKRLLIPYFFYGALLLFLSVFLFENINFKQSLYGLFYGRYSLFANTTENNIPFLQACESLSPLWFLPCMFLAYCILISFDNCSKAIKMFFIYASIILTLLSVYKPFLLPWSLDTCSFAFLYMVSGRYIGHKIALQKGYKNITYSILFFVIYICFCKLNPVINFSLGQYGQRGIMSVPLFFIEGVTEPLFLSFFFRFAERTLFSSIFAYIGRHSLRLLCIHIFISKVFGLFFVIYSYTSLAAFLIILFAIDFLLEKIFGILSNYIPFFKYL